MPVPSGCALMITPTGGTNHSGWRARSGLFRKSITTALSSLVSRGTSYRYSRLRSTQIRLLKLWPGVGTDPICCSLHVVDLLSYDDHTSRSPSKDLTQYDAVSYVWGDNTVRVEITCDYQTTRVTTNLADALGRFRDPFHPQILWIDALCINQDDLSERTAQVQLMGMIYFKARQVRIWLGQDREPVYHAEHAASLIQTISHTYRRGTETDARELSEKLFKEDRTADSIEWRALRHLLNLEWFKRVWVVQELGLSRDATFYCGEICFTRNEVYDFVFLLQHSKPGLSISYVIDLRILRLGQCYNNATWNNRDIEHSSSIEHGNAFLELLDQTRGLKCKDDRDLIYAFLGHPSARQWREDQGNESLYSDTSYDKRSLIIRPDYSGWITFHRVCAQLAITAVDEFGIGLQLLAYVAHKGEVVNAGVSSWMPLWNVFSQASHFDGFGVHYAASGSLVAPPIDVCVPMGAPCNSALFLRALRLAIIQNITPQPGMNSVRPLIEELFPERPAAPASMPPYTLDWPEARSRPRSIVNDWSAFVATLTAGLITTDADLVSVIAERHIKVHEDGLESYLRRFEGRPRRIQSQEEDEIAEHFLDDLLRATRSRAFFVTRDYRFGLAPMIAREGDQIWLPQGATMPFVFRWLREGMWQILGQVYLHGVMNGEAVEGRTERDFRTLIIR